MILKKIIEHFEGESLVIADGFDSAVIGITDDQRLVYSVDRCLKALMKEGKTHSEAREHFDYHVRGTYLGVQTPVWVNDEFLKQ